VKWPPNLVAHPTDPLSNTSFPAEDGHNLVVAKVGALKQAADGLMAKIVPAEVREVLVLHNVPPSVAEGPRGFDGEHWALPQKGHVLRQ